MLFTLCKDIISPASVGDFTMSLTLLGGLDKVVNTQEVIDAQGALDLVHHPLGAAPQQVTELALLSGGVIQQTWIGYDRFLSLSAEDQVVAGLVVGPDQPVVCADVGNVIFVQVVILVVDRVIKEWIGKVLEVPTLSFLNIPGRMWIQYLIAMYGNKLPFDIALGIPVHF